MLQVTVPLPERFNDGRRVPKEIIERIESEITAVSGGFSVTFGQGAWQNGKKICRDQNRFYSIDIEQHQLPDLKRALFRAKRELNQSELHVRIVNVQVDRIT